jgi:hypothetical protein
LIYALTLSVAVVVMAVPEECSNIWLQSTIEIKI